MTSGSKPKPPTDEIDVQAVDVEPTRRGYQLTYNYAVHFWLPILGPVPYAVWQVLISFCYGDRETCWPSIRLVADMAAAGNRKRVSGRWRGTGEDRHRQPGALEKLEDHGLLTVTTRNAGPETRYTFHVVKEPPLLPPRLVEQLPKRLRQMHSDLLTRCGMDLSTYQQLAARGGAEGLGGGAQGLGGGAQGTGGGAQGTANQYKESKMLEEIWRGIKNALAREMTQSNFLTYIRDTHAVAFDRGLGILIIQTPNPLTSQTLANTFRVVITRTMRQANLCIDGIPVYDVQFQSKR